MFDYFQKFDFSSTSSYLLVLHLSVLTFVAWNVLRADHMGFSWMRGKTPLLDGEEVHKFHIRVSVGLGLMIVTGLTLFWPLREYLLSQPQFYVKMGFVAGLIVNSFVINKFSAIPVTHTFESLTFKEKFPMLVSGAFSGLCWVGAFFGGLYLLG